MVTTAPGGAADVSPFTDLHQTQMLDLLPGVPPGTVIDYSLTFTWDGHSFDAPDAFTVGEGLPLAAFDFEGGSDQGWGLEGWPEEGADDPAAAAPACGVVCPEAGG